MKILSLILALTIARLITDQDVPFEDGQVLLPGTGYVVTADTDGPTKSVVFAVDGATTCIVSAPPFECQWTTGGVVGNHIFSATPWSETDGVGIKGTMQTVGFIVSSETPSPTPTPTSTPSGLPAAPSGLVATPFACLETDLSWIDNSDNESTFRIEKSPNGVDSWTEFVSTGANTTNYHYIFTNTGLKYYRIRARNAMGNSPYSNVVSADTRSLCTPTPKPTPIPTVTPTPTIPEIPTPTPSATPTVTPTATSTPTATPTQTPLPSPTATFTPVPTATATPTPTAQPTTNLAGWPERIMVDQYVYLAWSGVNTHWAKVYRNGVLIAVLVNDGEYTDLTGGHAHEAFVYKVCDEDDTNCSNDITVSF